MTNLAFIHDRKATEDWLDMMKISNYFILEQKAGEFSVSVDGNVHLSQRGLSAIPVQFARVKGFNCSGNKLTSLKGVPRYVDGIFDCSYNCLNSLECSPLEVSGNYKAEHNTIHTLAFLPKMIGGSLYLNVNQLSEIGLEKLKISESVFLYNNPIETIHSIPHQESMFNSRKTEGLMHFDTMAPFSVKFLAENPSFNPTYKLNKFSVPYSTFLPYIEAMKLDNMIAPSTIHKTILKI